jgi:HPt (histidine-containing phosphotransfer) domain-containing protein
MQTATLLDLTHLRLFTLGDADTEKMMLNEIAIELKSETGKLKDMIAQQDWLSLSRATHKLKTTLPFLGNQQLIKLNKEIEHASRVGSGMDKIPAWADEFFALLPRVIDQVDELIQA